jgi:hypothetical protein
MTDENPLQNDDQGPHDPEQEHPVQDAHGGSMAPGLVDDTGEPEPDAPEGDATR